MDTQLYTASLPLLFMAYIMATVVVGQTLSHLTAVLAGAD